MRTEPKYGEVWTHFKKKDYRIIGVAEHTENKKKFVVYRAMYGRFELYVCPYEMSMSPVDRDKYPNAKQKYRFEKKVAQME